MVVQNFRSRRHRSLARLAVMFALGAITAVVVRLSGNWAYAPSLGWAAASLIYLVWAWSIIGRRSPTATATHASREDSGRAASDALVLASTLASFGGVVLIRVDAGFTEGIAKAGSTAVTLGSITLSWFLVHALFTLRYAFLYDRDRDGVDFSTM
jgi:uncharacterized membrane protein